MVVAGCSVAAAPEPQKGGTAGGPSSGGFGNAPTKGSDNAPDGDGCSAEAKLVYVISQDQDLYSFNPTALTFKKVGHMDCPGAGGSPNSMAIDRSGVAWVNFNDGSLFKVSTKDAKCTQTGFQIGQNGFVKFGMAF